MSGWIQGENGNLNTKISEEKESAKISNFRTLQFQFRTLVWGVRKFRTLNWGIRTLKSIVWNCHSAWCSCLPKAISSSFQLQIVHGLSVGFLTFWALNWYKECRKLTSGSAPKVQWKTAAVSPVFIPCFLLLHCSFLVFLERLRQRIMRLHSLISS